MNEKWKSSIKKKGVRLCGFLLALCMAVTAIPALSRDAYAAPGDPAVREGTAALEGGANSGTAATVYFGTNAKYASFPPIAWRVIGYNGTGVASATGNIALITASTLGTTTTKFDNDGTSNEYSDSDLKRAVEYFVIGISTEEKDLAVVKRTLEIGRYNINGAEGVAGAEVSDAVLWPLSTKEANAMSPVLRGCAEGWWLRSPGQQNTKAAFVDSDGSVNHSGESVESEYGVRPAFHLNLSSVLFTSAAGGKSDFVAVGTNPTNEWKLTLKDGTKGFAADLPTEGNAGENVTVDVTAEGNGAHNQTSAMLVNDSGTVVAYGKIGDTAIGEKTFKIPATIPTGEYKLKVFREQVNGDYKTDYAGNVIQGTIQITGVNPQIERPDLWREFITETTQQIAVAKEGETITIESEGFNCLPLSVMKQMAMRRDLTIKMEYSYKGTQYNVTFPAGIPINYSEDIPYYGPLKLADMAMRDGGECIVK